MVAGETLRYKRQMRFFLRCEACVAAIALLTAYHVYYSDWRHFVTFFLLPDLSAIGYVRGPRFGAWCYNAAHTTIGPLLLAAVALRVHPGPAYTQAALIWGTHIAVDRALGYGLKHATGFKNSHLGAIGRGNIQASE
jgi:hypothetical protein